MISSNKKKILFIAMPESIHTARWILQLAEQGWDLHLFSFDHSCLVHEALRNVTIYFSFYGTKTNKSITYKGVFIFSNTFARALNWIIKKYFPKYRSWQLSRLIDKLNPDMIHSLETQKCGYLTQDAKDLSCKKFPTWIHTNWGSDIYLFGKMKNHKGKIEKVMQNIDYYSCECHRDIVLARKFGFKGKSLPVNPNTGGFDFEEINSIRQSGKPSKRHLIMLKGYQNWSGRALVGLRALERCKDLLGKYQINVYCVDSESVRIKIELLIGEYDIPINIIPRSASHEEILKLHGEARISIGLGISDAISTSMLEAMVMGSFPIQSWTSCADEWIIDGKTGILVPPEDPEVIEKAVRQALTDDELVDNAAELNYSLAKEKLDEKILKPKAIELYQYIYANRKGQA